MTFKAKFKRGFSDPVFAAGGESEYDREFKKVITRLCPYQLFHGGCHFPDCTQFCRGRRLAQEEIGQ